MKKLNDFKYGKSITIVILFVVLFSECGKKEEVEPSLDVSTFTVKGGQIWGMLDVKKADDVVERGVVISDIPGVTVDNNKNSTANIIQVDDYIYVFNDLPLNTNYYLKGYTKSKKGVIKYSNERIFATECLEIDSIVPGILSNASTQISIYGRNFGSSNSDNTVTFQGDCVIGGKVSKSTSTASSTLLTVDVTNLFYSSSCNVYVSVDNASDTCTKGGGILSKIDKTSSAGYSFSYSDILKLNL